MYTKKQSELLDFLRDRSKQTENMPSFDEMKEALALKSKSGIHRLVQALEERGAIERMPNRARAIRVVDMGARKTSVDRQAQPSTLEIPLMGRIAAGVPIEAIEAGDASVSVPLSFVGPGDHFALTVQGDSMIGAGIMDGDVVVIRKEPAPSDGSIVVALIDDYDATLKTIRRRSGTILLEAANPDYETRVLTADRVKIQGRMVGLLRSYN